MTKDPIDKRPTGTKDPIDKRPNDKRPNWRKTHGTKDPPGQKTQLTKDPPWQKTQFPRKKRPNSTSWIQKQTKNLQTKKSKIRQKLRKNYAILKDFLLFYGWHQNVVSPDPSGALEAAATIEYTQEGEQDVNWRQISWVH